MLAPLGVTGEGVARCRPEDFYVQDTGDLIALGRAIQDFGRQVEEQGLAQSMSGATVQQALDAAFGELERELREDAEAIRRGVLDRIAEVFR